MTCLPRSLFAHVRFSPHCSFNSLYRTANRIQANCAPRRVRKVWPAALCLFAAITLAASLPAQMLAPGATPATQKTQLRHGAVSPMVTGSDGSQTGIASFFGNFTAIAAPSGSLSMFHETDCSVSLLNGTYSISPTFTYAEVELASNYERTLHSLAQLTTTPDVYSKGCSKNPPPGFGSHPAALVGTTKNGVEVFAAVAPIYPSYVQGVYVLTADIALSLSSFQDSTAGALTAADLNGDGNGDLVIVDSASASAARVTVLLGNADGTFQNGVTYPIGGNYSTAAVIDDVNGDGKLDIVAVSGDQQISVLLGNGDGTFQAAQTFAAPTLPGYSGTVAEPIVGMITADLRGVGKKDIICSNGLVLLGNGNGTFTAAAAPAFPYTVDNLNAQGPNLASGDFNNDGKIDLVIDTGLTVSTWIGKGDGSFSQGQSYAAVDTNGFVGVDDLDGDGNADIVVAIGDGGTYGGDWANPSLVYALMGNGNGTFQGAPSLFSGAYNGNNLIDLNADGDPDLVTTNTSGALTVQLNNGKGAFLPGASITPPASFTLNGYNFTMSSGAQASSFALGDLNGDNKPDIAWVANGLTTINPGSGFAITYPYPILFVALGNGNGTFQTAVPYAFPQIAAASGFDNTNTVTNLEIADFTRDGKNDLIAVYNETGGGTGVNFYNQGIVVLPGAGNGTFTAPVLTSTYSSNTAPTTAFVPQIVNVSDLTGDNNPDLIVNSPGTTSINFQLQTLLQVYVSNGNGTFAAPVTVNVGADSYSTALADFNKDNKPDLAVLAETSAGQAELVVLPGNGDGTFGTATVSNLNGGDAIRSAGLAAADFDGDSNPDIALLDPNDFGGIFYGKGDGTFTSIPFGGAIIPKDLINIAAEAPAVAVDLNKDGKPDILAGGVSLLNIYGAGPTTTAATTTTLVTSLSPVVVGNSVKFTATVAGVSGSTGTPTGSSNFLDGTTTLGSGSLTAGVATFTTSALTATSHSITAVYLGDTNFSGSTSNIVTQVVNKATPTVTVTPVPTSITTAQGTAVTVAVAATTGNSTPTGSVVLSGGGYTSAATTLTAGSAVINIAAGALTTGTDTLTATYTPDSSSSSTYTTATGSNSVTVTAAPSFGLTNGGAITLAAGASTGNTSSISVNPANGFTGTVNLTCAVTTSPSGATSPATCGVTASVNVTGAGAANATVTVTTTSTTTPGAYAVTVTGISGAITQTTVVGVTVTAYVPPPSYALTNSGAITVTTPGATTGNTATITVTPSGGFTGSVALTAVLATSPSGATSPPTFSFGSTTPVSITSASAGTGTLTVTTTATTSSALTRPPLPGMPWYAAGGTALACFLLLFGAPLQRKRWRTILGVLLLLASITAGVASCGGKAKTITTIPGTTTGAYTITVTGTMGSTMQTTTVNLTVN